VNSHRTPLPVNQNRAAVRSPFRSSARHLLPSGQAPTGITDHLRLHAPPGASRPIRKPRAPALPLARPVPVPIITRSRPSLLRTGGIHRPLRVPAVILVGAICIAVIATLLLLPGQSHHTTPHRRAPAHRRVSRGNGQHRRGRPAIGPTHHRDRPTRSASELQRMSVKARQPPTPNASPPRGFGRTPVRLDGYEALHGPG
jgi:hypothetical protein